MELIIANKLVIISFLFAASELLAVIPGIKSNSIFQLIYNTLKKFNIK